MYHGIWRSLVARHLGVVEVAGSNPAIPNMNMNTRFAKEVSKRKTEFGSFFLDVSI